MIEDIVTRLRKAYKDADDVASVFLTNETADEIERLRKELSETRTQLAYWREIALENGK